MNNTEIWKDIEGYEGLYQVSNLGRVKSLPKQHGRRYWNNEFILKQNKSNNGYVCVILQKNKIKYRKSIHRLVASAFIPNFENKPQINHKDGNKLNNCIDNLEWVTASENQIHSRKNGLQVSVSGENHHSSKIINQYDLDGNFIKQWKCIRKVCELFNISPNCMYRCLINKRKEAGGYIWRYADEQI